ncbi:MAG: hypothetical protein ACI9FD_001942 [Gammaproteobacteria bacterium]|jgi:hypothetical protein
MDGLIDKRLGQASQRRAPVDEVLALEALYRERYDSWNINQRSGRDMDFQLTLQNDQKEHCSNCPLVQVHSS